MNVELDNELYTIKFREGSFFEDEKEIALLDYENKEIFISSDIKLNELGDLLKDLCLSVALRNEKELDFLSDENLDTIVSCVLNKADSVKTSLARLSGSIAGNFDKNFNL